MQHWLIDDAEMAAVQRAWQTEPTAAQLQAMGALSPDDRGRRRSHRRVETLGRLFGASVLAMSTAEDSSR